MSTDIDTCALIAAAIESIDKVGPFDCKFTLDSIDDIRASKKEDIVKRAKEIKQKWSTKSVSEGDSMLKDVHEGDTGKLTTYGKEKLPCSDGIFDSPLIILVEGRANVINLLRVGYHNALTIEGPKIIHGQSKLPSLHGNFSFPYVVSLPVSPSCTSFSIESPSLTDFVDHFCLISLARFTISSFFDALISSIESNVNLQSNGPTLSILSIAAAINAQVSISVLIGSKALPFVVNLH